MKQNLTVLSGAGISKESGINTFRDNNGLWEQYDVSKVASIDGWYSDPKLVLDFYNQRRRQLERVEPNRAHIILAELEQFFEVQIITQNVDNLHERAGSSSVIHLHGELTKAKSEYGNSPSIDIGYRDISLGDTDENGVQLRPDIVWFGEAVPMITEASEIVASADILLIIGTSLNVYPAAGLIHYAKNNTPIFLVDPEPIHLSIPNFRQIKEVATKGMEIFKADIIKQIEK